MIKITVELISAIDGHVETLAEGVVYNDGTSHTPTRGHYAVFLGRKGRTLTDVRDGRWVYRGGTVKNFPRQRKNVWWLLKEALNEALQ